MDLVKIAEQAKLANRNMQKALVNRDEDSFNKYAAGLDDFLMLYSYTQGHARRIHGGLQDETIEVIQNDDTRAHFDPTNEKVFVRYFLQPEYLDNSRTARPLQSWGAPYLRRISGAVVEGYFSRFESERITKRVEEASTYGFDIIEFAKDQTVKNVLDKEDNSFYRGMYALIDAQEAVGVGTGIKAMTLADFVSDPSGSIIDLFKQHVSPAKRQQPREFMIMPEQSYLDFAKIQEASITGLSKDFWDNGFGAKDMTNIYGTKTMRVDDATYLTCSSDSRLSKFSAEGSTDFQRYQFFGYTCTDAATLLANYGITYAATPRFIRILVLPPRNFLGKMLLWGSDMKTNIKNDNGYVTFGSGEHMAMIYHNLYAPTALDLWF